MKILRLADFRPDGEEGGGAEDVEAKSAKPELPDGMAEFLTKRGVKVDLIDADTAKAMSLMWQSRGEEIKNAQSARKRAQDAEAKIQQKGKQKLEEILPSLDDDDKELVKGWISASDNAGRLQQSLDLLSEAGLPMTPEINDLVKAGPEATRAYIAAIKKAHPDGNGIDIEAKLEQMVAKHVGVGADQKQQKQDNSNTKKSILDELRGPRTRNHDLLDKLRKSADESQVIKR